VISATTERSGLAIRKLRVTPSGDPGGHEADEHRDGAARTERGDHSEAGGHDMDQLPDTNAAIWQSEEGVQFWTAKAGERQQKRATQWQFMVELLPFAEQDEFTFLDLGAGTGAASSSSDPVVETTWERVNDHDDPEASASASIERLMEQSRYENHVRYVIPPDRQLDYLRSAGFQGVDVYWKHLENVI